MNERRSTPLYALPVIALLVLTSAVPAGAAVFQVTKTADTLDGACDSDCSLREALAAANATIAGDVVLLNPGVYTITRPGAHEDDGATGDFDVKRQLLILGSGADRTILDGGGLDRVLHVAAETQAEIHGVTVRDGWAKQATPPEPSGGNAGGILARGPLTLVGSHVTGNRADSYGGGLSGFMLTLRDSTISDNEAGIGGGGLDEGVVLRMENVTVSGNRAGNDGGGIRLFGGDQELVQVTVTGNTAAIGGGIAIDVQSCPGSCDYLFDITRSIVAGNTAASFPDCESLSANEGGYNVFGTGDGCSPGPTDESGTLAARLDAKLSPLGGYGGPTPTHLPLAGSPAIDLGQGCSGADQRGVARPADGDGDGLARCDAGAVEVSGVCVPGGGDLCLQGGRFRVTATWKTGSDDGTAQAFPLTSDTGAFWFFAPSNLELTIKVLDGCGVNDRFWVFLTGLTDVQVEVRVEDTQTHEVWTHTHAGRVPFQPRLDTDAFDTCQ